MSHSSTPLRIDFHIINQDKVNAYSYLAQLVEKIFSTKNRLLIYTNSLDESNKIDAYLWTYQDTSFLPHHVFEEASPLAPILISHTPLSIQQDVLINLSLTVPPFYREYQRIVELVYEDSTAKEQSRLKYKHYQKEGSQIYTFNRNVR